MCSKRKSVPFIFLLGLLVAVPSLSERVLAQGSFPSRPITMIIDQGPGGQNDVMVRSLSRAAEKELKQPVVCENKPGGGGVVSKNYILKSKPDGYTIGVQSISANDSQPHMQQLPYNVLTDQVDIAAYLRYAHALCVRADAPWKTIEDIVAYARQNPGKFTYATAAVGSPQHIVMERVAKKLGIVWSMVPFKSGSESVLACLGGHTNATVPGPADAISHIEAGKLRMILAMDEKRWAIEPNIPTCFEKYGFGTISYKSIFGPKGIPDQIVQKLQNAFKKAIDDPSYIQLAKTLHVDICYMSGKDYTKLWRSHYDEMGKIIKDLGLGK